MGPQPRPRQRRHRRRSKDEPFVYLTIRVGFCILCIGWAAMQVFLLISNQRNQWSAPSSHSPYTVRMSTNGGYQFGKTDSNAKNAATFPVFQLDPGRSKSDAFGIHDLLVAEQHTKEQPDLKAFYDEASRLKNQFAARYGGENAARYLLHSGVETFSLSAHAGKRAHDVSSVPSGLNHTAHRVLDARHRQRPFKVAFGGYSVTVGRGNYFNQSYPFVLRRLLTKPMKLLGVDLQVRNAAIGGVPSFPYGWCLDNFLGDDADVISWDYRSVAALMRHRIAWCGLGLSLSTQTTCSMNEAGGVTDGLEAYLRHGLSLKRQPMLIVKDTSATIAQQRRDLLQRCEYTISLCVRLQIMNPEQLMCCYVIIVHF